MPARAQNCHFRTARIVEPPPFRCQFPYEYGTNVDNYSAMSKTGALFTAPEPLRKGERTRLKLIESAFLSIARDGYYRTTFQTIADRAKVSQPLVVKAFRTRENIFPVVCGHLLELA